MPARGEPVEVLEDVAVPTADAGVLGHVDDPQAPVARARRAARRRPSARRRSCDQRSQNSRWDSRSRSPTVGAARDRLVVDEPRGREVQDAEARLPRPQAPVDVLVGHRVALVEQPDALDHLPAHVHARAGDGERRARAPGRPPVARLEAVAVVEPLRLIAVAHRAAELDAPVRVLQLRADDARVPVRWAPYCRHSSQPGQRLDVGVQHDHVARGVAGRAGRG